uniref:Uncharacterized protein n=1 Tax=Eutreptiella gymnastica TaxID=73025 RepID=A0A7S1N8W8_9EUGL|mmetsp:Transcript_140553/g.244682  ORF Transcript_140553/g.244682 Transcript_140553/m.244682 type:complete len:479 (+) Transcript_140553:56-1492(+)
MERDKKRQILAAIVGLLGVVVCYGASGRGLVRGFTTSEIAGHVTIEHNPPSPTSAMSGPVTKEDTAPSPVTIEDAPTSSVVNALDPAPNKGGSEEPPSTPVVVTHATSTTHTAAPPKMRTQGLSTPGLNQGPMVSPVATKPIRKRDRLLSVAYKPELWAPHLNNNHLKCPKFNPTIKSVKMDIKNGRILRELEPQHDRWWVGKEFPDNWSGASLANAKHFVENGFYMNQLYYRSAKLPYCTSGFFVEHMSGPERFMKDQGDTSSKEGADFVGNAADMTVHGCELHPPPKQKPSVISLIGWFGGRREHGFHYVHSWTPPEIRLKHLVGTVVSLNHYLDRTVVGVCGDYFNGTEVKTIWDTMAQYNVSLWKVVPLTCGPKHYPLDQLVKYTQEKLKHKEWRADYVYATEADLVLRATDVHKLTAQADKMQIYPIRCEDPWFGGDVAKNTVAYKEREHCMIYGRPMVCTKVGDQSSKGAYE